MEWNNTLDAINDWVVIVDVDRRVLRSNRTGEKFTGLSIGEIIGQSCCKLVHGSEKHIAGCPLLKMLKTGQHASAELKVPGKDCWLMVTADPVTDEKGDITSAVHIVYDITERKKVEDALLRSEDRFRMVCDQTGQLIYDYDMISSKVRWDGAIEKITGYSHEEFQSVDVNKWAEMIHSDDREMVVKLLEKAREEVGKYNVEFRFRHKDGNYRYIHEEGVFVGDERKNACRMVGAMRDVTERKAVAAAVERLAKFPEENPNPVLRVSDDGVVIYSNEAGSPLLGTWQCAVGGRLSEYWHRFVLDSLTSGRNRQIEVECEDRVYSLTIVPVAEGNYVNVYAMDVTGRKRAIDELLAYQNKLRSLTSKLAATEENERRRIAEGLHDDIVQPLVFLKIKIDELCKKSTDSEVAACYEDMMRVIDELTEMTRGFTFELSCPVTRELGLEAGIEEWLTTRIQAEHGLVTVFEDDGKDKPLDEEMKTFLFKAVRELLINTVKHAKASEARVSVRRDEGNIIVCVEDDGVGFEPVKGTNGFGRLSGFGLFSIRERLDYLGGNFKIESKLGHGTKVVLTAPLKEITKGWNVR